ncbi:membrane protein of ER body-like protein [Salvia divinorum]|uniref:Membrane protein of ER body-like protein n=1 Tax=Salvia divinorum TaxID=28513 RepID=A0ABD1HMF3_SALDI
MEVVHRRVEEEVVVVTVEEEVVPRRRGPDFADPRDDGDSESSDDTSSGGYEAHQNVISDENSAFFDNKKDHTELQHSEVDSHHEEISKIVHDVINRQHIVNFNAEIVTVPAGENVIVEESDDEEVVELEFERAVDKVHTHTPYCPNCSKQITKVILRRKKKASPRPDKPLDLLGCLSCFSIFIPSGDCLNPFGLFKSKPKLESHNIEDVQPPISVGGSKQGLKSPNIGPSTAVGSTTTNAAGTGNLLNPFYYYFGYNSKPKLQSPKIEIEQPSNDIDGSTTTNAPGNLEEAKPEHNPRDVTVDIKDGPEMVGGRPPLQQPLISEMVGGRPALEQPLVSGDQRSRSLEILKCVVYGGLIESIASLSIVSSTAASDTTTLNVVVIGLATLLSGLFAFGCNLVELRNDNSNEKYHEALGRKGHFMFHSTFAILSYAVFGLVAPVTYGFAFRDSNDKDYKILAVAAAGFGCIFVLAIAKAYVKGVDRFGGYVKTILYYVTMAVSASGSAYAAGELIGKLLDDLGWFQPAQVVASRVSSWASY